MSVGDVAWSSFIAAAPELAADVRQTLERYGFAFVGTVRRDGSPRISPVEVHILGGQLFVVLIPHTAKAHDLDRDARVTLQTPISSASDPGVEVKLRGRALSVLDSDERASMAASVAATSGWQPGDQWRYCELLLSSVALLDWVEGDMLLQRWTADHGLRVPERRRLELDRGAYVRLN
jgi:hypothetical protein